MSGSLRRLLRHRLFMTGLALFLIVLALAAFAPWITTADPNRLSFRNKFLAPSAEFVFGTDNFGRSLWSRAVWGARLSMEIGVAVVALNALFGTAVGALAGAFRPLDGPLMRVNDALMAFPAILLAIGITAVLGPSTENLILALAVVYIPRTARIVRASVLVLREMEYVQAAVAAGAGHWRVLRTHVIPNALAPLIVQLSFLFAYAVLTEATLSFLGLGAVPPTPTWGNIMAEAGSMREAPWIITIPGGLLMLTVMGLNLLGDGLRDVLDPRLRLQPLSLLSIEDLTVTFRGERAAETTAIEDVSLELAPGDILGVVGESGSGKSVTALSVMGLLPEPAAKVTRGRVAFEGQVLTGMAEHRLRRVRGPGIGMVFQEPMTSLNPVFPIGEQITETLRAHGENDRRTRLDIAVDMLERVGIPSAARRLKDYPHQLSGGQRQRVMIAIALACRPRLLIADEPTTALDLTIQASILDLILDLREQFGMAVLIITHNMGVIAEVADRVAVMYAGRVIEQAPVEQLFAAPGHPYTRALLACVPALDDDRERLAAIPGSLPDPRARPPGCRYAPRCALHLDACDAAIPALLPLGAGHEAACIRLGAT